MDIRHSSRMTTKHREPCPAGCEELNTQAELAKRMLCSRSEAGQRIVFGKLKAHSATANQVFYRTDDLNVYRGAAIAKIAESVRQLNASERDRIVRLFAEISAAENGRMVANVDDFKAGYSGAAASAAAGEHSLARRLVRRR